MKLKKPTFKPKDRRALREKRLQALENQLIATKAKIVAIKQKLSIS